MNYGSGVMGTIPLWDFMVAANITGIPHSILMTLVGKEINNIHGKFYHNSQLKYIYRHIRFQFY
jgi:uncharacterized membrane protein YdjX (TVP38/TMEM64 family)